MKHRHLIYICLLALAAIAAAQPASADPATGEAQRIKAKGDSCYNRRNFPQAMEYFTLSNAIANSQKDYSCYPECLGAIGNIYAVFKDYERANYYFRQAYEQSLAAKKMRYATLFLSDVVLTYSLSNDPKSARRYYDQRHRLPIDKDDRLMSAFYDRYLKGKIYEAEGRTDETIRVFNDIIAGKSGPVFTDYLVSSIYGELCDIYLNQHRYAEALAACDSVTAYARRHADNYFLVSAYEAKSRIYRTMGQQDSTVSYQYKYLELADSVFDQPRFNNASNKLLEYEKNLTDRNIYELKSKLTYQTVILIMAVTIIVLMSVMLALVAWKNRKIRLAQRMLISKNNDLIRLTESERRKAVSDSLSHPQPAAAPATATTEAPGEEPATRQTDTALQMKIEQQLMDVEVITQHDFSLTTLSELIGSNTTYVSNIINDRYGKTFKTLLNELRVNEACKRLTDDERYGMMTIEAVSESVGYSSQSHFIKMFQRQTGMTPSVYRKISLAEK